MIYVLLHGVGASYWLATFLGNSFGACVSYFLNRIYTFKSSASIRGSAIKFGVVILLCYFIAYFLGIRFAVFVLQPLVSLPPNLIKDVAILVGTGLYTLLNYAGQRWFVFSGENLRMERRE